VFWTFLVIFIIAMPSLWFYTTGYRFDLTGEEGNIVGVGGLYVSSDAQNIEFFVDEVQVTNYRIFRKAAYIQNLVEGTHKVHVQGDGLQTWTKDLPVHSYIVTEAFAFMMPSVPRVRVIAPYTTATGTGVLRTPTGELPFPFASTTNSIIATTSKATTTLRANQEFTFVAGLFTSSAATTTSRVADLADKTLRQFVTLPTATATPATTTKSTQNALLHIEDGEVNVVWRGAESDRPYYYCVGDVRASTTPRMSGAHVYEDMLTEAITHGAASTSLEAAEALEGKRVCRDSIRIDKKGQEVKWFDFFPGTTDLVLMLLDDGLYVVEADDRAWQNTQLLYGGRDLKAVVDGSRIYVKDGEHYLEVFTTVEE
jgi:hypothetical protein